MEEQNIKKLKKFQFECRTCTDIITLYFMDKIKADDYAINEYGLICDECWKQYESNR